MAFWCAVLPNEKVHCLATSVQRQCLSAQCTHDQLPLLLGQSSSPHEIPANNLVRQRHIVSFQLPQCSFNFTSIFLQRRVLLPMHRAENASKSPGRFVLKTLSSLSRIFCIAVGPSSLVIGMSSHASQSTTFQRHQNMKLVSEDLPAKLIFFSYRSNLFLYSL